MKEILKNMYYISICFPIFKYLIHSRKTPNCKRHDAYRTKKNLGHLKIFLRLSIQTMNNRREGVNAWYNKKPRNMLCFLNFYGRIARWAHHLWCQVFNYPFLCPISTLNEKNMHFYWIWQTNCLCKTMVRHVTAMKETNSGEAYHSKTKAKTSTNSLNL